MSTHRAGALAHFARFGFDLKPLPGKAGLDVPTAACRECSNQGVVRGSHRSAIPPEIAAKKLRQAGWRDHGGRWTCPNCITIEKEQRMAAQAATPSHGPDLKTLRIIMEALERHFEVDRGVYLNSKSDELLAKELGYSRAIIAKVREDAFGPLKPQIPPEVIQLQRDVADMRQLFAEIETRVGKVVASFHR